MRDRADSQILVPDPNAASFSMSCGTRGLRKRVHHKAWIEVTMSIPIRIILYIVSTKVVHEGLAHDEAELEHVNPSRYVPQPPIMRAGLRGSIE